MSGSAVMGIEGAEQWLSDLTMGLLLIQQKEQIAGWTTLALL